MRTSILPRPGDRIEVLAMPGDPDPIPAGERGTVERVNETSLGAQVWVVWDDPRRSLMLTVPPDRFYVVNPDDPRERVRRAILVARSEGWIPDPYAVAETLCDEDVSRGDYDGCSPELDLAASEYAKLAATALLAADASAF